jgi:trimeric autotransporter adhesin
VGLIGYVGGYLPGSVTNSVLAANRTKEAWATFAVTNAYNSGYMPSQVNGATRLAALANSKTADRSGYSNTLTENGTVTEAAVETGAELLGYSGFSASNYLSRAYDADFDMSTGEFCVVGWAKVEATALSETMVSRERVVSGGNQWVVRISAGGVWQLDNVGGSSATSVQSGLDDGLWHFVVAQRRAGVFEVWVDTILGVTLSNTLDYNNASAILAIGARADTTLPAANSTFSLVRIAKGYALNASNLRSRKGMFAANAKCLLQGAATQS